MGPRVALVVVDDGLYTHRWVTPLILNPGFPIVLVAVLDAFSARNFNPAAPPGRWRVVRARARYYGLFATVKFAAAWARQRWLDALFRLRLRATPGSVVSATRRAGVPVRRVRDGDVNSRAMLAVLESHQPDLLICAFSQKAGLEFLKVARLGCLNVHFSLLPQHRGREPGFWSLLHGSGAGVSVHWMNPEIDAGAVVCQEAYGIAQCRTLHETILRGCEVAERVVRKSVCLAGDWSGDRICQDPLPPLNRWPAPEDVKVFRERGFRFM